MCSVLNKDILRYIRYDVFNVNRSTTEINISVTLCSIWIDPLQFNHTWVSMPGVADLQWLGSGRWRQLSDNRCWAPERPAAASVIVQWWDSPFPYYSHTPIRNSNSVGRVWEMKVPSLSLSLQILWMMPNVDTHTHTVYTFIYIFVICIYIYLPVVKSWIWKKTLHPYWGNVISLFF